MLVLITFCLIASHTCFALNISETAQTVSNFVEFIGWTKLTVICTTADEQCLAFSMKVGKMSHKVINTVYNNVSLCNSFYMTSLIIWITPTYTFESNRSIILNHIKSVSAYTTLVISHNNVWKKELNQPLGFYYLNLHMKNAITKVTVTRKKDNIASFESRETTNLLSFNMEGAYLHIVTLPYKPYLEMSMCFSNKPCKVTTGFTYDLIQAVAADANFTMSIYMHDPPHWGTIPRQINGEVMPATGVVKSVLDGTTDLPLSVWIITPFRFSYMDFTIPFHYMSYRCFADVNQVSNSGWRFIIKPFTHLIWIGVLLTTFVILLCQWLILKFGDSHYLSYKLIIVIGGLGFTVLFSFYSGAQTMFLASDREAPFDTILDGLTNHPEWTFLLPHGDENIFLNLFGHMSNEPSITWIFEQAEKHRANPMTIVEAFEMLSKGKYYVLTSLSRVASNLNDQTLKSLSVFCNNAEVHNLHAFPLPKYSPFTRSINQGLIRLRKIGVLDMLIRKLRRKEEETIFASTKHNTSMGIYFQQISLMFYVGCVVIIFVLMLLIVEKCIFELK